MRSKCQVSRWRAFLMVALASVIAVGHGAAAAGPPGPLGKVAFEQHLNAQVPLTLSFRDEQGRGVTLGEYFGKRPVILVLAYYGCPNLCTMVLNSTLRTLNALDFTSGKQFDVVVVSIDPRETPELAREKKAVYLKQYHRAGGEGGWHFLTGEEAAIHTLTDTVGFRFAYDAQTQQFAHASGITVLTPAGRIARYFFGIEYSVPDMRFALMESSEERIGTRVEQLLLFCYHYDPATGRYGLAIVNFIRFACGATVMGLGSFMFIMLRRDRRRMGTVTRG